MKHGDEQEHDTVVVRTKAGTKLAQEIRIGDHVLVGDEPKALGGDDTGPSPYDLLLASLGSCTAMTLRMYAERKGWPLTDVVLRLKQYKQHATDCADCETDKGRIDRISLKVELVGDLDDAQRARLMELAARCPVHRTLTGEIKIDTSVS